MYVCYVINCNYCNCNVKIIFIPRKYFISSRGVGRVLLVCESITGRFASSERFSQKPVPVFEQKQNKKNTTIQSYKNAN